MGESETIQMKDAIFKIEGSSVEDTLLWAKDVAGLDVDHLRSCMVAGGELCEICLSLSEYYEQNLLHVRKMIEGGEGDSIVNQKRLPLLEIEEKTNNLVGYLTLLQMDAMLSLINMMEAKSDVERLVACKHAYTIIHDAKIKGLFRVISREMNDLPEEVISESERKDLWNSIKGIVRKMISEEEAEQVRNNIDAHKEASFIKQIEGISGMRFRAMFCQYVCSYRNCMDTSASNERHSSEPYQARRGFCR